MHTMSSKNYINYYKQTIAQLYKKLNSVPAVK